MPRASRQIEHLRQAIDLLPVRTRVAMLDGVRSNAIIVGAYSDRRGGVCPMLAAHRCGARTDALAFARAWDGFARVGHRPRRATARELRVLETHLEASLELEEGLDLATAIAEHRAALAAKPRLDPAGALVAAAPVHASADPDCASASRPDVADSERATAPASSAADSDRAAELRHRAGWAWLRPFRRLDDYEAALSAATAQAEESAQIARDAVAQSPSPGRVNMISGMTQAGDSFVR